MWKAGKVRECVEEILGFPLSPPLVGLDQLEGTDLDGKLPKDGCQLINRDASVTRNAHPKHSKSIVEKGITERDVGQNLVASQVTLEERTMTELGEEKQNLGKRPTNSDLRYR